MKQKHLSKGRAMDNITVERLWRSVKYEEVYPKEHECVTALTEALCRLRQPRAAASKRWRSHRRRGVSRQGMPGAGRVRGTYQLSD
jgi:hypothetical protein